LFLFASFSSSSFSLSFSSFSSFLLVQIFEREKSNLFSDPFQSQRIAQKILLSLLNTINTSNNNNPSRRRDQEQLVRTIFLQFLVLRWQKVGFLFEKLIKNNNNNNRNNQLVMVPVVPSEVIQVCRCFSDFLWRFLAAIDRSNEKSNVSEEIHRLVQGTGMSAAVSLFNQSSSSLGELL
jgi:hypothetical protein